MQLLRNKRVSLGLTLTQMAELFGMDVRNFTYFESGKRIFKTNQLLKVKELYKLSNEELLQYIEYVNNK